MTAVLVALAAAAGFAAGWWACNERHETRATEEKAKLPVPLPPDELAELKREYADCPVWNDVRRLVATVEQARRERDAAEAPSVELVQALLESENVVDRLTTERDAALAKGFGQRTLDLLKKYEALKAEHQDCLTVVHQQEQDLANAYAAIRRSDATWSYVFSTDDRAVPEGEFTPGEVDAIRRARATPGGDSDE